MPLKGSGRLAVILLAAHVLLAGCLLPLPMPAVLLAALLALLLLSAMHTVYHQALRQGRRAIIALAPVDRKHIRVLLRDGRWQSGQVLDSSTVGPGLTVLNLRFEAQRRPCHLVLLGDSMEAEDFRRLRVWLRWGPQSKTDAALDEI